MQQVYIPLEQTWDNLDDAINYFRKVTYDLEVLKGLSDPPTDLYLSITDPDYDLHNPSVTLRNV